MIRHPAAGKASALKGRAARPAFPPASWLALRHMCRVVAGKAIPVACFLLVTRVIVPAAAQQRRVAGRDPHRVPAAGGTRAGGQAEPAGWPAWPQPVLRACPACHPSTRHAEPHAGTRTVTSAMSPAAPGTGARDLPTMTKELA